MLVELEGRFLGPQIIWIRAGAMSTKQNRVMFLIVLRRPRHRNIEHTQESGAQEETPAEGIIERPIAENQFVQSTFKCQVGDIIVLEGGERIRARKEGDVGPPDFCLLATMHSARRREEVA